MAPQVSRLSIKGIRACPLPARKRAVKGPLCSADIARDIAGARLKRHIRPMAIRKIARMGHPVLDRVAAPVPDPGADWVRLLVEDMIETLIDANGAGLAATQVYEPWRIVIFQAPATRAPEGLAAAEVYDHTAPLTVLINPEIEIMGEGRESGWEGCLSVPGLRGLVARPDDILYRGISLTGERIERRAKGFHARVVQHECDHLDGILYPQRMDDLSQLIFESEWGHRIAAARAAKEQAQQEAGHG